MDKTKQKFIESMEYLGKYYLNFKADFTDPLVQRVWFDSLKQINIHDLEFVVKDYCSKNTFAPQSPTSLLEHYNKIFEVRVVDIISEASYLVDKNLKLVEVEIPFYGKETKYVTNYDAAIADASGAIKEVLISVKKGVIKLEKNDVTKYLTSIRKHQVLLEGKFYEKH